MTLSHAIALIEADAPEWHDFCAECGHIPDNVAHMRSVRTLFAVWLASIALEKPTVDN